MSAVLRIAICTQGGEQHETDKEPGNAFIGYLAHRLGLDRINPGSQWPEPDLGDTRHCSRCFDPAGSVGCSVSRSAVLVSDWTGPLHSAHERQTRVSPTTARTRFFGMGVRLKAGVFSGVTVAGDCRVSRRGRRLFAQGLSGLKCYRMPSSSPGRRNQE